MTYDSSLPSRLKKTQQWFASIITRPIDENSQMNPISPSGRSMVEESFEYIIPSPTLQPHQRIKIYNQQYWWRLLSNLHDTFPLTTRLFGYMGFNFAIGIPYLEKYPSNHWSLNFLGNRLPLWVEEEYAAEDKQLVYDAVSIDWGYNEAFLAKHKPPFGHEALCDLLKEKVTTQPHLHLFKFQSDLFSFRAEFLKQDPDYWVNNDFPPLKRDRTYFFALYRSVKNTMSWEEIAEGEYELLSRFAKICSIDEACEWLQNTPNLHEGAEKHFQEWFHKWTVKQWLAVAL